jgi:hypothetical protein
VIDDSTLPVPKRHQETRGCMEIIELDAREWRTAIDVLTALRTALGVPERFGFKLDAFVDAMIEGGLTRIEPPYAVRIVGYASACLEVRAYLPVLARMLEMAREERRARSGSDIEVSLKIVEGTGQ